MSMDVRMPTEGGSPKTSAPLGIKTSLLVGLAGAACAVALGLLAQAIHAPTYVLVVVVNLVAIATGIIASVLGAPKKIVA
jgi:hypothetical protein